MNIKGFPFDTFTPATNKLMLDLGIEQTLIDFASANIERNDVAHRHDHVEDVILKVFEYYNALYDTADTSLVADEKRQAVMAALLHDIGCWMDRDAHHLIASNWVLSLREDQFSQMFYGINPDDITAVAVAILEHRASWKFARKSAVSDIVAAADRGSFCPKEYLRRAYLYGRSKLKMRGSEALIRAVDHFMEKYKDGGYVYEAMPEICKRLNQAGIAEIKAAANNRTWCEDTIAENMLEWEVTYEEMTNASS